MIRAFRFGMRGLATVACILAMLLLAGCAARTVPEGPAPERAADIRLATYNVHFLDMGAGDAAPWGMRRWMERRDPLVRLVRAQDADIVAFQEVETHGADSGGKDIWQDWLSRTLREYRVAAGQVGDGVSVGQPIFYRPSVYELRDDGFALFSNPDARFQSVRAFVGYPDAVTWARLRHRTSGRSITVFNVHLHYLDSAQRLRSARRVLSLASRAQARGDAVFVIGDFNARRNSRTLRLFYEAGFGRVSENGASFHFNTGLHLFGAIDHILHDGRTGPAGTSSIDRRRPGGLWPSDHYPVRAGFDFVR